MFFQISPAEPMACASLDALVMFPVRRNGWLYSVVISVAERARFHIFTSSSVPSNHLLSGFEYFEPICGYLSTAASLMLPVRPDDIGVWALRYSFTLLPS